MSAERQFIHHIGLGTRLILLAAVTALLVSTLGGWLLRQSIQTTLLNHFAQRLEEKADRLESGFFVTPQEQRIHWRGRNDDEFSRIFSGWYWQLAETPPPLVSRSLWDSRIDMSQAAVRQQPNLIEVMGPQGIPLLGIERSFIVEESNIRLHVFGPASDINNELARLDQILLLTQMGLLLVLLTFSFFQVRLGLTPLRRLGKRLSEVRTGLASNIGNDYGPELNPLAEELDLLLARNARIVDRARNHAADLSHALKKPLALLSADCEMTDHPLLREQILAMSQLIERHLARAGSGAGSNRWVHVLECVNKLTRLMEQLHHQKALNWQIDCPEKLLWRGEQTDLEEMLGNLLDNAGKWANTRVTLHARRQDACLLIEINDDGPGLSAQQIGQTGIRGRRFDESTDGTGLGLAITSDIAATYGGELTLARGPLGGLQVRLQLPD